MDKWICPIHNQEEYHCVKDDEGYEFHSKRSKYIDDIFGQAISPEKFAQKLGWAIPKGVTTNKTPPKKKRKS